LKELFIMLRMMRGCLLLAFLCEASSFSAVPCAGHRGVVPRIKGHERQPLYPSLSSVSGAGRHRQRRAQIGGQVRMSSDPGELLFSEKSDGGGYVSCSTPPCLSSSALSLSFLQPKPSLPLPPPPHHHHPFTSLAYFSLCERWIDRCTCNLLNSGGGRGMDSSA
jgi:hypothetical protein